MSDPSDPPLSADEDDDPDDEDSPDDEASEPASPDRWHREGLETFRDLCPVLAELRIVRVDIPFNGYGDSGSVDEPEAYRAAGPAIDLPRDVADRLVAAAEGLLPDGWEDNHGSHGLIVLDVPARTVRREQTWLTEESEDHEETLPA